MRIPIYGDLRHLKLIDADYTLCQQGRDPPLKKKYIDADSRIHRLVQGYQPVNPHNDHYYQMHPNPQLIIDFLQGISQTIFCYMSHLLIL